MKPKVTPVSLAFSNLVSQSPLLLLSSGGPALLTARWNGCSNLQPSQATSLLETLSQTLLWLTLLLHLGFWRRTIPLCTLYKLLITELITIYHTVSWLLEEESSTVKNLVCFYIYNALGGCSPLNSRVT